MSLFINNNSGPIYNECNVTIHNGVSELVNEETPSTIPPDFFCISARFTEENIRERLAAELNQASSKIDFCRALYRLQHMGCINIDQYASDAQRAQVFNNFQSRYHLAPNDFCRARMTV